MENRQTPTMRWQPVATWDAHLRYKIGKNLTAELVGTNLGNRYYLDPINPTHCRARAEPSG